MSESQPAARLEGRTAWARSVETPLRDFLRTETGSAVVLLGGHSGRAGLGEHRRCLVQRPLAHDALDPHRRRGARPGPAPLGQQRPHDVLLLRHRARGAARVRRGRVAGAVAGHAAPGRGHRRDDRAGAHLSRLQRGPRFGAGVGSRHVDRHRLRAGHARARWRAQAGPPARVPADGGRDRRHRGAARHRARLHGAPGAWGAARGSRPVRGRAARSRGARPPRHRLCRARAGDLGRALRIGRRAGRRGAGNGTADLRVPGGSFGPRGGERALPLLPGAADARARPLGPGRRAVGDLSQRSSAAAVPPLDELRDRAVVRARQRRHRRQRRAFYEGPSPRPSRSAS